MEPSALHSQIATYKEGDNCLFFVLGLARATGELRRLADHQRLAGGLETTGQETPAAVAADDSDVALYFLLGLLSFSQRFQQVTRRIEVDPKKTASVARADGERLEPPASLRELLR